MIPLISLGSGRCNLFDQAFIHPRALRRRALRLTRQARRAIRVQRESAVVNYLCARRFPLKSKEAMILRLLAQSAMHRRKRLERVLSCLRNTRNVQPGVWLLAGDVFAPHMLPGSGFLFGLDITKI